METVLVFPCGLPDAIAYATDARSQGRRVVGASSLRFDPAAVHYDDWLYLPYVHDETFVGELTTAVSKAGITTIFTPHDVVSSVLAEVLPASFPGVRLQNTSPIQAKTRDYATLHQRAVALEGAADWFHGPARPRLSGARLSGTLRLVDTIAGMTDNDKIAALIEIFRDAPAGDIVEIGSWWGRSAALLLLLSRHYGLGNVLCVDPWTSDTATINQGVAALDASSARLDWEDAFTIFQANLAPLSQGRLNVLRGTSLQGAAQYRPGLTVTTDAFGDTTYDGRIAVLHIDGNHSFERADEDARAWTPHVVPGGVIIIDDYVWAFGDGPKRVGDAWLAAHADRIAFSFVMGTALFIKLLP